MIFSFLSVCVCAKKALDSLQTQELNMCPYNYFLNFETDLNVVTQCSTEEDFCLLAGSVVCVEAACSN